MPRAKRDTTTTHTIKLVDGGVVAADDSVNELANAPLFAIADETTVSHIVVFRTEPDEGTLGRMPPTTTELEIKRKWGGGTFQLQARDERNRPIKNGFKTVTISGDPIFESKAAQARWNRQQGLDEDHASPATAGDAFSMKDIFALLSGNEAKQKAETERRIAEQQAAHQRDLERIRVEADIRERERAAEDVRRDRAQQEREERQRKDEEQREERRRKDEELARQRDREFAAMLASLTKKGGDGSDMLLKGVELASKLSEGGGGGPVDPVSAVAAALLPGLVEKFGPAKVAPAAAGVPAAGAAAAAASADAVTFDGELGRKTSALVAHLQAQGFDPETSIAGVFDKLLQARRTSPQVAGPAPAAPGAPAAAPAPKATAQEKRRTTKK